jgi:uncharacterized membrane protein
MTKTTKGVQLPLLGGWARNLAAGAMFVGCVVCFLTAFWVSWSRGITGQPKGDQAIGDILVAVAVIAFGLWMTVMFLSFFLLDIAVRVGRLESQAQHTPNGSTQSK